MRLPVTAKIALVIAGVAQQRMLLAIFRRHEFHLLSQPCLSPETPGVAASTSGSMPNLDSVLQPPKASWLRVIALVRGCGPPPRLA